jgi:RNA polymerase sigma-70 factor (family 1)
MEISNDDLLRKISLGDEKAFRFLFASKRNKVFNYVLKITKSREISEEIVMDVFLKLWEGRALLTELENLSAFISTVARNKSLDFLRSVAKDKVLKDIVWDEIELVSSLATDERLISRELAEEIDDAVKRLSPQRQSVYRLSREEHMTYDQIATHLHLSKATVKNHMLDALKILRLHLGRSLQLTAMGILLLEEYFNSH